VFVTANWCPHNPETPCHETHNGPSRRCRRRRRGASHPTIGTLVRPRRVLARTRGSHSPVAAAAAAVVLPRRRCRGAGVAAARGIRRRDEHRGGQPAQQRLRRARRLWRAPTILSKAARGRALHLHRHGRAPTNITRGALPRVHVLEPVLHAGDARPLRHAGPRPAPRRDARGAFAARVALL
jgi:hypothetical protein